VYPEVLQHVKDGGEPQVLDPALTVRVDGQSQVLCPTLDFELWM